MTPIFKNTEVSLKDVGQQMQEYAKQYNIKDVPRRLVIGFYFGNKIGLMTPLLKLYLEHGLVINYSYLHCHQICSQCSIERFHCSSS